VAETRTYRFGPLESRSFLGGLRLSQVVIVAAGGLVGVFILRLAPSGAGLAMAMAAMGVAASLAFWKVGGRSLDEWLLPAGRWLGGLGGGRRWTSASPMVGDVAGRGGHLAPPPPLVGISILTVNLETGREVGVIKDRAGTYTAVLAVRGKAFALLDRHAQERRLSAWADLLSGWAREGTPLFRLQWVERTMPEDADAMGAYLREQMAAERGSPIVRSYVDLLEQAAPLSQRHEVLVAVSISMRKCARLIKQAGGGDRGAAELLVREVRNLEVRLRAADLLVEGALSPREVARALRTAYDPDDATGLTHRAVEDPDMAGASAKNGFPLATETFWDCYRTDGTWHATFWVAEWPRLDVGPDFLTPVLLQTTGVRSVSVVMEPVPPSKATKAVEMARTSFLADEELRSKAGFMATARRQREHDAIVRRETELADGHAEYRFSGYVTVSGPDRESLEYLANQVVQAAHQCRLDLRRLYGEQDVAFVATLPIGRGLR
jgi:hypothetical protein